MDKISVDNLKSMLDKIVSDGKGDYRISLCIEFKDAISNYNKHPKIDINVNVNDKNKIVTLSEVISF